MKKLALICALSGILLLGCADHEKEEALQKALSQAEADRQSYQTLLNERDKYVEGVMKEINEIYADLEATRAKEGKLKAQPAGVEGKTTATDLDTRKQLLSNIASLGDALKENRKRIADLRARLKSSQGEIARSKCGLRGGGGRSPRETCYSAPRMLEGVTCVSHRGRADSWIGSMAYILPSKSSITSINNTNPMPPLG